MNSISTRQRGPSPGAGGWALIETVTALAVLMILIVCTARLQASIATRNRRLLATQNCLAAGQAQLDCLAATGAVMADEDIERLWPGVVCTVARRPGRGEWTDLTLVEVVTTIDLGPKPLTVEQRRYIGSTERVQP